MPCLFIARWSRAPVGVDVSRHVNTVRATIWLCYVLIGLLVMGTISKFWWMAHDPMWAQMSESRDSYYVLGTGNLLFAGAVWYGLWQRREWGRILGMSYCVVTLLTYVGTTFLGPYLVPDIEVEMVTWDTLLIGALSVACLVGLGRTRFAK